MIIEVTDEAAMKSWGTKLGALLVGGEVIELLGDVGAGKTTLTKGIALGLGVSDPVQSPSFTISRLYEARDGLQLAHYDFYRLSEPGIMANELLETIQEPGIVTVIEWAAIVDDVLPEDRITIQIMAPTETKRTLTITSDGSTGQTLLEKLA